MTTTARLSPPPDAALANGGRRLRYGSHSLHPLWLYERSTEPDVVDASNRQRIYEPLGIPEHLSIESVHSGDGGVSLAFSNGHRCTIGHQVLARWLDGSNLDEEPPAPVMWTASDVAVPVIEWSGLVSADPSVRHAAEVQSLRPFFELGMFVLRGTRAEPGALHEIATRFGRISSTSFGTLFDVRTEPVPVDLAYTPVALSAHTDQPYRMPTPGLQFLHAIVNDAPGGDSTMVDGFAAIDALRREDPSAYDMLCATPVEYRYDIGTDVKAVRAPMIDLDGHGRVRQFRYSPRLDFAPAIDPDALDVYYRGRRSLARLLNDPARQITFRLQAGDVLVVDNHRVLHGRTSFDPTVGSRHLQGCYIDHDGPATMWTLAVRRAKAQ